MMTKIVYFSQTGQTRKFVNKVKDYPKIEITADNYAIEMDTSFILVVPSYESHVDPVVIDTAADFLETANNITFCKGLFGGGNRNFASLFCVTAKSLAETYDLPFLHAFEFQGSPSDVKALKEELRKYDA